MRLRRGRSTAAAVLAGVLGATALWATPAAAATPTAGISIGPGSHPLQVAFAAKAMFFNGHIVSYKWSFGDATTATTTTPMIGHTYAAAGTYTTSVSITDSAAHQATARGKLELFKCPSGTGQCSTELSSTGRVTLLQVSGPIHSTHPAEANLFIDPFRINACEAAIGPAVAVTDSGFAGNLTMTFQYTTANPNGSEPTCFYSTVLFADTAGTRVRAGLLPNCAASGPVAPCVQSYGLNVDTVTKVLLIPPGDPRVGAP